MSQQQHDGDIAAAAPEPATMDGSTLNLDDDPEVLVDDSTERLPLTELAAGSEENAGENGETSEPQRGGTDGGDALKAKTMETFEIDQSLEVPSILQQISQDMDDLDEEAQGLLSESPPPKPAGKTYCFCCGPTEEVGSSTIVCPGIYARSGWGIIGPHSFGPPCVVAVILSASYGFIHRALTKVGPITGSICILWTLMICYHLINTAYRDPGIVREKNEQPTKAHRWCDLCQNFQPVRFAFACSFVCSFRVRGSPLLCWSFSDSAWRCTLP
jgi:hypothetical protein